MLLSRHATAVAIMNTQQEFVFAQGWGLQHFPMNREDALEAPPIPEELWSVVGSCWRGAMFFSDTVIGRLVGKKEFMKRRGCMRITRGKCNHNKLYPPILPHTHTHTHIIFLSYIANIIAK